MDYVLSSWAFLIPPLLSCIAVTFVLAAIGSSAALRRSGAARARIFHEVHRGTFLAFGFGVLGWTIGYLTGASRVGVVGDLLPAILGIFGAVAGYTTLRYGQTILVSMMMLSLTFGLFVGATQGATIRAHHDALDLMMPDLEALQIEADKEYQIRKYRKDLRLEWPPVYEPSWARSKPDNKK